MVITSKIFFNLIVSAITMFGLIMCLFGYRISRLILAITGFIIGISVVSTLGFDLTEGKEIPFVLLAAVVGGSIIGVLLLYLYSTGVFILGILFGIFVFSVTLTISETSFNPIFYLLPAIAGGIFALFLQRFTIVIITSFTGAFVSVIGGFTIINHTGDLEFLNNISQIHVYRIILSTLALGFLGVITQYFILPKKPDLNVSRQLATDDNKD